MKRRIELTKVFLKDIKLVVCYIRKDKPIAAEKFKKIILRKARSLNHFSERGKIVSEINAEGNNVYREIIIGNYRMIYKVLKEKIIIMRFIHGSRNIQNEFSLIGEQND